MLRFTFWNSGLALYLSNSRSQSSSVRGYFSPKNLHSVMLSPLRVSRVTPPSTTIEYTHAEHPASHTPSAVDCAAVILRAIGLTRPAAAAAEEATTFFAADAVCAPRKAAPADPGAMVTVLLLLLLLLLLDEKFLYCDKTDGFDDAFDDDAAAAANPLSATCLLFI